jgi:RNA polymerase sigma factor (sigma-70 family)
VVAPETAWKNLLFEDVMEIARPGVVLLMSNGDEDFYRKHADGLMRLSVALVGPADAEDVFSSAVLNVLSARTCSTLDDDSKRGYLYRSIVNEARTWAKRVGQRRAVESLCGARDFVEGQSSEGPEIWEAVAALSVRQRAVVFLTYWEDLDTAAVGERLGISVGSVYRHLHRARTGLRRSIDV